MNNKTAVLSTAYLPPIQYMAKLISYNSIAIEINETYAKQSYRNRCVILSCNGPLTLSIPVVKVNGNKTLTKDIEIDNATNWQKNHWKAIESAYRNSTYFDFVADIINPSYSRKERFLVDFNNKLIEEILGFLRLKLLLNSTNEFIKIYPDTDDDFRSSIHPKAQYQLLDNKFMPVNYYQVFNDRFKFYPNLSIIDLLFNEGLDSIGIIDRSIIKKPA